MNIKLNDKNQYKKLVSILPEYANTVLFKVPDYVDFRDEAFYKKFSKKLMSSTNTDNWIGSKKPIIPMSFRYYFDEEVVNYMKEFEHFFDGENTLLQHGHIDISFLKFNQEIMFTVSHEGDIIIVDEEFIKRLKQDVIFDATY